MRTKIFVNWYELAGKKKMHRGRPWFTIYTYTRTHARMHARMHAHAHTYKVSGFLFCIFFKALDGSSPHLFEADSSNICKGLILGDAHEDELPIKHQQCQ